jgi:hypothetical protein
MLLLWPAVCVVLFQRLSFERALIWSILGAYLVLPPIAEFDLPLVPDMDKYSIPSITALAICLFQLRKPVSFLPRPWSVRLLLVLFVFGVIPTVLTNSDPVIFEVLENTDPIVFITNALPGLRAIDVFSAISTQIITLLPFFLARQFLGTETGMRELLVAFVIAGLAYSLPALLEIRISPQINIWVYGFFQHSFEQMIRAGGYRPIVFLPHGLWLAFFFMSTMIAAAALSRTVPFKARMRYLAATAYLFVVLMLCKSLASLAYGAALAPLVLLAGPKTLIRVALLFAVVAVTYPMLRNLHLIPLDDILMRAEAISAARAESLEYRFINEEQLLDRAAERPWFGWGGWGRNLVRDGETGDILSIPDGRWIIAFGSFGWVGYIGEMGLLAAPLALLWWTTRKMPRAEISPYIAPLAILLAITMMDMLLNATLIPLTWLLTGAILGHVERVQATRASRAAPRLFDSGPAIGRPRADGRRTVL